MLKYYKKHFPSVIASACQRKKWHNLYARSNPENTLFDIIFSVLFNLDCFAFQHIIIFLVYLTLAMTGKWLEYKFIKIYYPSSSLKIPVL